MEIVVFPMFHCFALASSSDWAFWSAEKELTIAIMAVWLFPVHQQHSFKLWENMGLFAHLCDTVEM